MNVKFEWFKRDSFVIYVGMEGVYVGGWGGKLVGRGGFRVGWEMGWVRVIS